MIWNCHCEVQRRHHGRRTVWGPHVGACCGSADRNIIQPRRCPISMVDTASTRGIAGKLRAITTPACTMSTYVDRPASP